MSQTESFSGNPEAEASLTLSRTHSCKRLSAHWVIEHLVVLGTQRRMNRHHLCNLTCVAFCSFGSGSSEPVRGGDPPGVGAERRQRDSPLFLAGPLLFTKPILYAGTVGGPEMKQPLSPREAHSQVGERD